MSYTNETINKYSKPLSSTEKSQCESSIRVFESILDKYGFSITKKTYSSSDDDLSFGFHVKKDSLEFTIMLQGSYGNGTCVRQDSDVDIAMICESTFRGKYPSGRCASDFGFVNSNFSILNFKNDLCDFINTYDIYYCKNNNKCLDFMGNGSSRKDIDIVPSLRYRDYSKTYSLDAEEYIKGVLIKCQDGKEIINYPEQSRDNNSAKNNSTNFYYKKIVRILKNIKHDLEDNGVDAAEYVSSYGLECLVYNVPNNYFIPSSKYTDESTLKLMVRNVLDYLRISNFMFSTFYETNGILKLFDNPNNNVKTYQELIEIMKNVL